MKAVMVTTQNISVNVITFLCMGQRKSKSLHKYLGRLKGKTRHCDFILAPGQTPYTDNMIIHTLVQELEHAAITKDLIDKYAKN